MTENLIKKWMAKYLRCQKKKGFSDWHFLPLFVRMVHFPRYFIFVFFLFFFFSKKFPLSPLPPEKLYGYFGNSVSIYEWKYQDEIFSSFNANVMVTDEGQKLRAFGFSFPPFFFLLLSFHFDFFFTTFEKFSQCWGNSREKKITPLRRNRCFNIRIFSAVLILFRRKGKKFWWSICLRKWRVGGGVKKFVTGSFICEYLVYIFHLGKLEKYEKYSKNTEWS